MCEAGQTDHKSHGKIDQSFNIRLFAYFMTEISEICLFLLNNFNSFQCKVLGRHFAECSAKSTCSDNGWKAQFTALNFLSLFPFYGPVTETKL